MNWWRTVMRELIISKFVPDSPWLVPRNHKPVGAPSYSPTSFPWHPPKLIPAPLYFYFEHSFRIDLLYPMVLLGQVLLYSFTSNEDAKHTNVNKMDWKKLHQRKDLSDIEQVSVLKNIKFAYLVAAVACELINNYETKTGIIGTSTS